MDCRQQSFPIFPPREALFSSRFPFPRASRDRAMQRFVVGRPWILLAMAALPLRRRRAS